jgi:hypothetical protein
VLAISVFRAYITHLAERIEDLVKVDEDLAFRNLGNVVHALARIVSDSRILVGEAGENGGYDFFEIAGDFLHHGSAQVVSLQGSNTYRSQSYRGCRQSDEPAISGVGVVDGVCVFVAELVHNAGYPVVVLRIQCIPNEGLKLEGTALALVVQLIVERFSNVGVHGGVLVCSECVHRVDASSTALCHGVGTRKS